MDKQQKKIAQPSQTQACDDRATSNNIFPVYRMKPEPNKTSEDQSIELSIKLTLKVSREVITKILLPLSFLLTSYIPLPDSHYRPPTDPPPSQAQTINQEQNE